MQKKLSKFFLFLCLSAHAEITDKAFIGVEKVGKEIMNDGEYSFSTSKKFFEKPVLVTGHSHLNPMYGYLALTKGKIESLRFMSENME